MNETHYTVDNKILTREQLFVLYYNAALTINTYNEIKTKVKYPWLTGIIYKDNTERALGNYFDNNLLLPGKYCIYCHILNLRHTKDCKSSTIFTKEEYSVLLKYLRNNPKVLRDISINIVNYYIINSH